MKKMFLILLFITVAAYIYSQEKGLATYYGKKFDKRKTTSGEIYYKDSLVCAHRTHPFGTLLKVRNPKNNKEIIVKVIDRGPFHKKRVIDLSYAVAKALDIIHHGVAEVEILVHNTEDELFRLSPDISQ